MPTLNSVTDAVHPALANNRTTPVRIGERLTATIATPMPMMTTQRRIAASAPKRKRSVDTLRAPVTAPKSEGSEHDAVGLGAAAQEVARGDRHQRSHGTANNPDHQSPDKQHADRGGVPYATNTGNDRARQTFWRQARGLLRAASERQHED